jgi:hypothetical protein
MNLFRLGSGTRRDEGAENARKNERQESEPIGDDGLHMQGPALVEDADDKQPGPNGSADAGPEAQATPHCEDGDAPGGHDRATLAPLVLGNVGQARAPLQKASLEDRLTRLRKQLAIREAPAEDSATEPSGETGIAPMAAGNTPAEQPAEAKPAEGVDPSSEDTEISLPSHAEAEPSMQTPELSPPEQEPSMQASEPAPSEPEPALQTPQPSPPEPEPVLENTADRSPSPMVAVPSPTTGRAGRRAGRVRTRLLGFEHSSNDDGDVFEKASAGTATAQGKYPVGWLVVVKGPGRGASFTLANGVSQIGRGEDQAVTLDFGDTSISRQGHAVIAYDSELRKHFLGHGGKVNIVRLNDRPVLSTENLSDGDHIRVGETTLRFVAFCGAEFDWSEGQSDDDDADVAHG